MTGSTEKTRLQIAPSIKSTDTPDGVVLLDVRGGMCFPLDQVGTLIWKRLEQQLPIDVIAQEIVRTYRIPLQQASVDVQEFVWQLQANHLLIHEETKAESGNLPWTALVGQFCRWVARRRNITRGA
jgi:hypothetical protein